MGRGAPVGNNNRTKAKPWVDALRRVLVRYERPANPEKGWAKIERGQALAAIADNVVAMALAGDMWAIQEIGNRLDGKPVAVVAGAGENGEHVFTGLTIKLVHPGEADR